MILNSHIDEFTLRPATEEPSPIQKTTVHGIRSSQLINDAFIATQYGQPRQITEAQREYFQKTLEVIYTNNC